MSTIGKAEVTIDEWPKQTDRSIDRWIDAGELSSFTTVALDA